MALGTSRSANMSSGLLLDPLPSPTAEPAPNGVTRFRPYASPDHHVTKARYITSNDPRGYIPVYEYPLNGQWIMLDMDDGYVLWTGIWKALGNSKADIVKIIDSQPDLAAQLRRVRGGYLKIQGTWMPYEIALRLARRVAWPIRHDLVPLFGPTFPETCLPPDNPGFGQISKPGTGKRRARRNPPAEMPLNLTSSSGADWSVAVSDAGPPNVNSAPLSSRSTLVMSHTFASQPGRHIDTTFSTHHQQLAPAYSQGQSDSPVMLHVPYVERAHAAVSPTSSTSTSSSFFHSGASRRHSPPLDSGSSGVRYSPYPSPLSSTTSRFSATSAHSAQSPGGADSSISISPTSSRPLGETIKLPPIQPPSRHTSRDGAGGAFQLPPISSMDNLREAQCGEPMAVLRRLQSSDEDDIDHAESRAASTQRRHSLAVADAMHAYKPSDPASARTTGGSRTPLSAVAALPSSSYLHSRHEQQQQHYYPHPNPSHTHAQGLFDRRPSHDDRPARSVPPSPYLDGSRLDFSDRARDRDVLNRERPFILHDRERVGVFYRQERPPSPPRSASSHSPSASASVSASSSPSDSARPGWRPW